MEDGNSAAREQYLNEEQFDLIFSVQDEGNKIDQAWEEHRAEEL